MPPRTLEDRSGFYKGALDLARVVDKFFLIPLIEGRSTPKKDSS